MAAPQRPATRTAPTGLPTIPRHNLEARERAQIQYLIWRFDLFLKDAGATKDRRDEFKHELSRRWRSGAPYEELCLAIERHAAGFLAKQVSTIQDIFNEK